MFCFSSYTSRLCRACLVGTRRVESTSSPDYVLFLSHSLKSNSVSFIYRFYMKKKFRMFTILKEKPGNAWAKKKINA